MGRSFFFPVFWRTPSSLTPDLTGADNYLPPGAFLHHFPVQILGYVGWHVAFK